MDKLYFALVDTPGFFATLIRSFIKQDYIHVVLSMDEDFEEAYTVGRRHPSIPLFAGFTQEHIPQVLRAFPNARYKIFSIPCEIEVKARIHEELIECYRHRFQYHYCIIGLLFVLLDKPFYQKNHYTCSSYIARLLEDHGMPLFNKHFSLVNPKDFMNLADTELIFEGKLQDFASGVDVCTLPGQWNGEPYEA